MRRLCITHHSTPCKAKESKRLDCPVGRQLLHAAALLTANTCACGHLEYAVNFTLQPAILALSSVKSGCSVDLPLLHC